MQDSRGVKYLKVIYWVRKIDIVEEWEAEEGEVE